MRTEISHGGRPSARGVRAAVFAVVMTVLAVLAHAAAGAMVPGVAMTAAAGLAVGAAAYPLTSRERGLPAVLAATAGAQLLLHVLFTLDMTSPCVASTAPAAGTTAAVGMGMGMSGRPGVGCAPGSWVDMGDRSGAKMLALHVLAGLVSAWWLRRGERALARLVRLLWPLVIWLSFAVRTRSPAIAGAGWFVTVAAKGEAGGSLARLLLVRAVPRRGPPALRAC